MKVLIKKRFRDADTLQLMFPGQHAEYAIERAKKLAKSGFVQLLEVDEAVEEDPIEEEWINDEPGSGLRLDDTGEASDSETTEQAEDDTVPEKAEVSHTPKSETSGRPKGKPGRKPKK